MHNAEIIISEYSKTPVITAFIENKMEYIAFARNSEYQNIYIGKVDHVVKNLDAAFVKYSNDKIGYLPLKHLIKACVINRKLNDGDKVRSGDEVIVQVEAEPIKSKKTKLSTSLSVSGKYCVITLGRTGVGASLKLPDNIRFALTEAVKNNVKELNSEYFSRLMCESFGVIIRTGASKIPESEIKDVITADIRRCLDFLADMLDRASKRTIYSLIYDSNFEFGNAKEADNFSEINDLIENAEDYFNLDISIKLHVDKAIAFLKSRNEGKIRIINDTGIFGINSKIEDLCSNKVWLKSGAFLIIEQLESFNAIDVNTGKAIKGKSSILEKVNFEAADEIMRQIRLRNLTGMILIDFINMDTREQYDRLVEHISFLCRKDPVHTQFIDVTGLGIMELTRNKNDKSLKEILVEVKKNVDKD